MFSKKGALELSISLLVIIIISLVILVGGIIFLYFAINSTEVSQQLIEESLEENSVANQVQDSAKQELIREENIENNTELEESPDETKEKDCLEDFTCDDYFIYVPLGEWERQELFEVKAEERAHFFVDISKFKFRKVGNIYLSLDFVNTACKLTNIRQESAPDHLKIKRCADRYADSLGIDYEKAIGLTNSFTGGQAFFKTKSVYTSLGFSEGGIEEERPVLVAHELGHTYSLCDEYSFTIYQAQNRYFGYNTCENKFPDQCLKTSKKCLGNTPTFRDYGGERVINVCKGEEGYSVMGFSTGVECGYDQTGGYEAVGDFE